VFNMIVNFDRLQGRPGNGDAEQAGQK